MELREMIELAAAKVGDQKTLERELGLAAGYLSPAKSGRRGLPSVACGKLADILGIDRWTVVAASELVTEKSEEKRAYLAPFVTAIADFVMPPVATSGAPSVGWRRGRDSNPR